MLESLGQDGNPSKLTEMVMKVSDSYSIAALYIRILYIFDIHIGCTIYVRMYFIYIRTYSILYIL